MAAYQLKAAPGVADHPAPEPMTAADVDAHRAASHVRRTAVVEQPVLPPLPPAGTAARRRVIAQRRW